MERSGDVFLGVFLNGLKRDVLCSEDIDLQIGKNE